MTNGEMIKTMFPNITERFTNTDEYTNKPTRVEISIGMHILTTISADVWNAEYKESTAKNDLGVDCVSRQEVLRLLANSIGKTNTYLQTKVLKMPSVTPQEPMVIPIAEVKFDKDKLKELVDKAVFTVIPNREREILDKIRAEIIKYEGDCRLSVEEYPSCKQCTDNVFESIYGILDKYKAESEG